MERTNIVTLENEEDINTYITNSKVCIVDFFTTWCGPCKTVSKFMHDDKLFNKNQEELTILKVDADKFEELSTKFEISALPTLVFFCNGELEKEHVKGADTKKITEITTRLLNS